MSLYGGFSILVWYIMPLIHLTVNQVFSSFPCRRIAVCTKSVQTKIKLKANCCHSNVINLVHFFSPPSSMAARILCLSVLGGTVYSTDIGDKISTIFQATCRVLWVWLNTVVERFPGELSTTISDSPGQISVLVSKRRCSLVPGAVWRIHAVPLVKLQSEHTPWY